jgi:hypothetical protein
MPAEEIGEVVRDYQATFYDISFNTVQDFRMCLQDVL